MPTSTCSEVISLLAVLKAQPLKVAELPTLLQPFDRKVGIWNMICYQVREMPGTFYMRESLCSRVALDDHIAPSHFQTCSMSLKKLLAIPLQLIYMNRVESKE